MFFSMPSRGKTFCTETEARVRSGRHRGGIACWQCVPAQVESVFHLSARTVRHKTWAEGQDFWGFRSASGLPHALWATPASSSREVKQGVQVGALLLP